MAPLKYDMIDIRAVEQQANAMRAEATAAAFRKAGTWLRAHLHFGNGQAIG